LLAGEAAGGGGKMKTKREAMPKKVKPKLNTYRIISDAIEQGIPGGVRRYYKYRDNEKEPQDMDAMTESVLNYIMLEVSEVTDFNDDEA
jgi:hypothetical protein